jgi:MPBQ/MSBQ methyltransferase
MRLIQHKKEAYWFYRFLSLVYDRINPLFWTEAMRTAALALARLDDRALDTLDVGAGTGFTTEGIVACVDAGRVVMLDQSPHQLARSRSRPALAPCRRRLGDAEALPFPDASFDRYVSAGSIEYWPDPQRAIAEAHRVLRVGGVALVVGPVPPPNRLARALARAWMLFPAEDQYRAWFERAGFGDVRVAPLAPEWHDGAYAVAVAGTKICDRAAVGVAALVAERVDEPMTVRRRALFAARFALGSLAGAAFIPIAVAGRARRRWRRLRAT